jgi:hypothetical protein
MRRDDEGGSQAIGRVALERVRVATRLDARVMGLLTLAYGSERDAADAVARATTAAGLSAPPVDRVDIIAFVRTFVLPGVEQHVGTRLARALFEDVLVALDGPAPSEAEASSDVFSRAMPSVVLIDADPLRRARLARTLLAESVGVAAVGEPRELGAPDPSAPLDAIVAFLQNEKDVHAMRRALDFHGGQVRCIVVLCDDADLCRRVLASSLGDAGVVLPAATSTPDLIGLLRHALG